MRLTLRSNLCPGDVATMTAAIESLHLAHPGEYITNVQTSCPELWEFNPWIIRFDLSRSDRVIDLNYPLIQSSNQRIVNFLEGYTADLASQLGVDIPLAVRRPVIYLSDQEKSWISQIEEVVGRKTQFWLVNAGVKSDVTNKSWPVEYYQTVIDATRDRVVWVQIGDSSGDHPLLSGVLDLRGQTSVRQLVRLAYHSDGGIGPCSFLMHLCAAFDKPYMCLSGGREPVNWVQYPLQQTFHSIGSLSCCKTEACWRAKVVRVPGDDGTTCEFPVLGRSRWSPKCMAMISPMTVVDVLTRYLR